MSKRHLIFLTLISVLMGTASAADNTNDEILATVNGQPIKQSLLDQYSDMWKSKGERNNQSNMLTELVQIELIRQEALKLGLDKDPAVQKDLQLLKMKLYIREVTNRAIANFPISDDMVQQKYNQLLASTNLTEYKAKHILSEKKDDALAIIAALKQSNDSKTFTTLAQQKSIDPSGQTGGDLGWFNAASMDPAFITAVKALKKGAYSQTPAHTQYGWHTILLEDTRTINPPPLTEVKSQLIEIIKGKHLERYLAALKEKATIEILTKPVTP